MILPDSTTFDQRTMTLLLEHDPVVQRYRDFFALFDWSQAHAPAVDPSRPGKRPHPQSAYLKALLLKREEGMSTCTQLRRYLLEHPLVVLERGLRPVLNRDLPYGFEVAKTVPTDRWLRQQQHDLEQPVLQGLLAATVRDLREEIPGLGEVVADARDAYLRLRQGKQFTGLRQRALQEGSATARRSRLQAGGQEEHQS
jgi:hypothetical protein